MASRRFLSSIIALAFTIMSASISFGHEVAPAIADMSQKGAVLHLDISLSLEGILAGINLSETQDTGAAPEAARYDALRALSEDAFATEARAFWPQMAAGFAIMADGERLTPNLDNIKVFPAEDLELARDSTLHLSLPLPEDARTITFAWDAAFGGIVLRQQGVDAPYTGFLESGATSPPIALVGGGAKTGWQAFASYVPVGFYHILPKGLDHILFVLGLFFLSVKLRPLLTQITMFTVAHTITLALAALGWVTVPAAIVEPLIAVSIVFIAVENIFTSGLSRWRPFVVFGFGLLHGLGFASVLGEFGLPEGVFIPALIGFNIGVELGQITLIAVAFMLVGARFGARDWYRSRISIPASIAIAIMGAWWVIERTLL